jgi:hypothetical protein
MAVQIREIPEELKTEAAKAQRLLSMLPGWLKDILRSGPYRADYDEATGRWWIEKVEIGNG